VSSGTDRREDIIDVAVVIPTVGRTDLLRAAVRSVEACSPAPAQVVIVDQGDGCAARAAQDIVPVSRLTIVRQPRLGVSAAMNAGLRVARHDVVLVTHDDCTVREDWIGVGAALAARYPAALLTGRVLPPGDPARTPSTITDRVARVYMGTATPFVLYPANMVLPRLMILEMGGFDESFRAAAEDNDLCYRWLRDGGQVRFEPELAVWHHDWRTDRELRRLYQRYWHSQGLLYGKHLKRGDGKMLACLGRDLRSIARRPLGLLLGRRQPGIDWRTCGASGLITGLIAGLTSAWPEQSERSPSRGAPEEDGDQPQRVVAE
jgi:GT2 family glycosyltransferase